VERKKDEVQKKRQEEDKKEMEYVMDFALIHEYGTWSAR